MQTQTEKKKTVREQMIAVGLQTVVVVVVVVVLLLFVGVVSGSGTLYVFTNFKDDFEGNTRARRQTDRQTERQTEREFTTSTQTLSSSSRDDYDAQQNSTAKAYIKLVIVSSHW